MGSQTSQADLVANLRARAEEAEGTLKAIRREFERRDMDASDVLQAVTDLFDSHRTHLLAHREEKEKRARAEAASASLLKSLQRIVVAVQEEVARG